MRVLHYILGFPPMRRGGMTHYAIDLMKTQVSQGHDVYALYPGNCSLFCHKSYLVCKKDYTKIKVFELSNSLPVPLLYGVKNPQSFISKRNIDGMEQFLEEVKPDVFHIHTLMGLPIELVQFIKSNNVKIVYTTHDYFGICPKVNLINEKGEFCKKHGSGDCLLCNKSAKSTLFLKFRNSIIVRVLKEFL